MAIQPLKLCSGSLRLGIGSEDEPEGADEALEELDAAEAACSAIELSL